MTHDRQRNVDPRAGASREDGEDILDLGRVRDLEGGGVCETLAVPVRGPAEVALRIYIAGPMTGYEALNFPAFHAAAKRLRDTGWHVENPAEINTDPNAEWSACMRADIAQLVTCDAIYMLPGWRKSKGATLEHHIARELGLCVILHTEAL